MKSYFKSTQGTGYSKESYQECVCDIEEFLHNLPFVPVGLFIHRACVKEDLPITGVSRTFRVPKVVPNVITVYEENQWATRVVPGGDCGFLFGGLNCTVLSPFYLVFRDCQPAFRTNINITRLLSFNIVSLINNDTNLISPFGLQACSLVPPDSKTKQPP